MEWLRPVKTETQRANAPEAELFELVYQGPDVDDGTMDARQLAEVLTGLTRAFSTVAFESDLEDRYQLRIRDIESNSIHIVFEAVAFAKAHPEAATAIAAGTTVALSATTNIVSGAYRVITDIAKLMDAKKRLKRARVATVPASFNDGVVSITFSDDLIILTKEQYELLLSQRVDRPISQIVSPLALNRINSFQIRQSQADLVTVEARQKDYFDFMDLTEEENKEGTEIVGTFNSLSKTNLRGTFYTSEGIHVPYKYVGDDIGQLFRGFSAREPLRVRGRIKYGSDGVPNQIEVQDIEFLQRGLLDK